MAVKIIKAGCSIEVALERTFAADVQGDAMVPAPQHFGVSQLQADYIKTLFLQEFDQGRLVSINHDQVRVDAEQIHINPLAADASGQIFAI
jgi:hypothetical protein